MNIMEAVERNGRLVTRAMITDNERERHDLLQQATRADNEVQEHWLRENAANLPESQREEFLRLALLGLPADRSNALRRFFHTPPGIEMTEHPYVLKFRVRYLSKPQMEIGWA